MNLRRIFRHLLAPGWVVRRAFPRRALARIEAAIAASEVKHRGELRFAVEGALDFLLVWHDIPVRQRAVDLFSELRVWDTEDNCGVLIYLQLVDHDVEIVADRGIARSVPQARWDELCHDMEEAFRAGRYEEGTLRAVEEIGTLLAQHFPPGEDNPNELPDRPVVL